MKKDISLSEPFSSLIPPNTYYDFETPYGYGGPLCEYETISQEIENIFLKEITDYCEKNSIVSQFIRFHPLLMNHLLLPNAISDRYMRDTVYIDTLSPEIIMQNMDSKNRNMVRKAQKNGVQILNTSIENYHDFIPIYNETMNHNNANDYYYFSDKYFSSLHSLTDNAHIFYALYENKPIAGSIFFFANKTMHYHLSGSLIEYRKYSPSNLLLYEAACWASNNNISQLHLGGGLAPNDSLFGFKKQFNKNGFAPFHVGRTIFIPSKYDYLLSIRKKYDETFDINNNFMIQYRK